MFLIKKECDIIKPLYVSMSHGRLFRIASEWQKKKKTIWRVWSGMRKTWKMRAAALLLTWGVYYGNAKYLGTNDVKYILIRGAVRDESVTSSGSEEFPNNIWGYGRLNLINSFLELRVT